MSAPRTARAIARDQLTQAILDSAGRQLAEVGPAALSLRAVSRDLGMVSSALYRYFPSRDALLTALLIEAYDGLGDAVERADAACARDDLAGRWRAACHGLRDWAVAEPHRYALLYGSPVPGYHAPEDTIAAAVRINLVLLQIARDAQEAGRPVGADPVPVGAAERSAIAPVLAFTDPPLAAERGVRALSSWATLFGHLSLELFGHLHGGVLDYDVHFAQVVDQLARDLGLDAVA